ncbi:multifunctional transcriptional regulator/nicotinamide-nucleotide adenylyltransferase/ribosylnicotinamide kinase NadR [Wohlfahrtiimonas chitiniclastica]|uniref:multifunctional transcriptional regulator/nicotinamide-nucleotide adenylyltransferase/ribosylnicotinamide kinase NadR n=1 Tax=Wohlfahrtiimonas chitiniclastica TaxID=400946 RepID=UPI001BD0204A|nr:multifunctional transcriptional regulator/nicotinamide-nucleotide adenylyltransferase/ribosylnicotinamide kinase NadR [Wohlfahrtiimonas chitiniclastica]MBS7837706.1 multifunctional transcriptional regulator/nicotinamide-nucleotide adenylyltransferase/ribosylnicotinamide kinase NadR [Wohlfahrtiimonas chitiniclastica]
MINMAYVKKVIKDKGLTLQNVADHCDMTKGYLSQLLNNKVQNPSATKLNALYQYLNINPQTEDKTVGLIFGAFYPLHTGHVYLIQRAISQLDELHIILRYNEARDLQTFKDSAMSRQPSLKDRLRWLLQTFKYQKNIHIHYIDEENLTQSMDDQIKWANKVDEFLQSHNIDPNVIYSSETHDVDFYQKHLGLPTKVIDPERTFMNICSEDIRRSPLHHWEYIPTEVRPFFVKTIAILGGESSGKSTMVNKLANMFNTTSAWEYGREYVFKHLGGDERALQFSDYDKIALGHAQYIDFAVKHANKIAFIDTDFITTQAFCMKYEGKSNPFVQAMIDTYRFDLVILLENNTPWVADGLRHLGSNHVRKEFQCLLKSLLAENNVPYVEITSDQYDERYLQCIDLVDGLLKNSL